MREILKSEINAELLVDMVSDVDTLEDLANAITREIPTVKAMSESNKAIDEKVVKLLTMDKNTFEYMDLYNELFTTVTKMGAKKLEYDVYVLKARGMRVDEDEMMSEIVYKAFLYQLSKFDLDTNYNFVNLYFRKYKQLLVSYLRKLDAKCRAIFTYSDNSAFETGDKNKSFGVTDTYLEDRDADSPLHRLLDEFIAIHPKGEILRLCENYSTQERTEHILRILGVSEYGVRERQVVRRLKEKFRKFLIDKNYRF